MHEDTRIQHHGEDRERFLGSVSPPVFRSSLFTFPDCESFERTLRGEEDRPVYSRESNPTVDVLERKVADLEHADAAVAFASGMGAVSAVLLTFASSGDHVVCFSRAYSPTLSLSRGLLERMGVRVTFVDVGDLARLEDLIEERTRLLYMESPASLTMDVIDLEEVARVGKARGIVTATDNSWATPLYHKPLDAGIDLSVHSGTKYISGHSDLLLGIVAGRGAPVARVRRQATLLGATLSPADAFLALRGLRTLPLRMQRHQESALHLARRLLLRDEVTDVLHPALPFFPSHALWKRQFTGSSGLFSFRLRGDARRFADALELFALGFSWGGFESLVLPQAIQARVQPKKKVRQDIPDDLVRLSVGLEDPEDLWKDLERGFAAAGGGA